MDKIGNLETIWGGIEDKRNVELCFFCKIGKYENAVMEWIAKDVYNLFINGQFVVYGPARAAKGYSRLERVEITPVLTEEENGIAVYVQSNCTNTLCFAKEDPLFGARICADDTVIRKTADFQCFQLTDKLQRVERMSSQRGFLEIYDMKENREPMMPGRFPAVETKSVNCPKLLARNVSYAKNEEREATLIKAGRAYGGARKEWINEFTRQLDWGLELDGYARKDCSQLLSEEFLAFFFEDGTASDGLPCLIYQLPHVYCGKFKIKVKVSRPTTIWLTYDDLVREGYVQFNREQIIHGAKWTLQEGNYTLFTQEVYSAKYIQLIVDGEPEIEEVSVICIENPKADISEIPSMKKELYSIVEAARNTFAQNAYDIFTDCPSRERAGWLCDSYFMGKAEQFFTKENKVEKNFLENYLLYENEKFPHKGIMPMCYPSYPKSENSYIPNWILWYLLELEDYQNRTEDSAFIGLHRQRILDILDFFRGYENEYGLLENLEGWVFVEWSKASDFVQDVNFPSNMLYADALRAAGVLLKDEKLLDKSAALKKRIFEMSFNGDVFVDNAIRKNGALELADANISELCQNFAAYFQIVQDNPKFYENFKNRFQNSPYKDKIYPSALFIGDILRLMVLFNMEEYELLLQESEERFLDMASKTGTIWELFGENASCNHGFGSILGKLICNAQELKGRRLK